MAEAGADRLCPAPRAPRNPATRSRAGDRTAAVSPSQAPRARGSRPAERRLSKSKIREARKKKSQGLTCPSSARNTALGCDALVEQEAASAPEWQRAGRGLLALGAVRRGGNAAGSPARSTLHPPGHCPERLQDRQRVGAGNYKSNPSSRGIKLQRKRTSQGKKKKRKKKKARRGGGVQRLSDSRALRAQILESCRSHQRKQASVQKSPTKEEEGLLGARLGSYRAARRGGRLHSPAEVRGARANGWREGGQEAGRRGRCRGGGRGAGVLEARRGAGRDGGRRLSEGAGAQRSTRGAQPGRRGQRRGVGGDNVTGRSRAGTGGGGGERWGRGRGRKGAGRRERRGLRLGRS